MYYITQTNKDNKNFERLPFHSKKAAVGYFKVLAYETIYEIEKRGNRPDVMTIETVYDGERTVYEVSIVEITDDLVVYNRAHIYITTY